MRHGISHVSLIVLALTLHTAPLLAADAKAPASLLTNHIAITSIALEGTNLVLSAVIPAGVEQVILEIRPTLDAPWERHGLLDIQAGVSELAFTIPKPTHAMALFRLNARRRSDSTPMVSSEARYVTMPSLGLSRAQNGDAVFHFKGSVDGSDTIVITREGALWSHKNWAWPRDAVTINGTQWKPQEKNYLTTLGVSKFLPEAFSLESVKLEVLQGRDVVALERAANALIVYLDDTPVGPGDYEFVIHFHPVVPKSVRVVPSVAARLKIAARIDGSDRLKITATEATWEHKAWAYPTGVTMNNVPWLPKITPVLKNEGTNTFLPPGIDLSTATIVGRKGRDLATMWADSNAVWVWFADNPGGNDAYELEIAFGQ